MGAEQRLTYCNICEALCGLVATVEHDRVVELRTDPDHPMSAGYACPKGIAMTELQNDPDRVLHPLRRRGDGSGFDTVSWDEALDDIASRLRATRGSHGGDAIGWYAGVPYTFSFGHHLWVKGFLAALGSPHHYGAISQDVGSRFAASALLYGSAFETPLPDVERTQFMLILGANPFVSNGSYLTAPRIRERLHRIIERGGRIVVIDPRRTETAASFEHVAVRPDSDAWLLLSMLHVLFEEDLCDREFLDRHASGTEALRGAVASYPPETTEPDTGVPAGLVRRLARDFASSSSAVAYGRTGACRGRFGTLVCFLLDALNIVTGNLDRPGGWIFSETAIPSRRLGTLLGLDSYGRKLSRVGGLPDVLGELPTALMAKAITTPGPGRLRALLMSAGNPIHTVPNADELAVALQDLELFVSLDLYVNDTNRYADYVLPATTWLERPQTAHWHAAAWVTPFIQYTPPVVAPYGQAREEWQVIEQLSTRLGLVPQIARPMRMLGRLGMRRSPTAMQDMLLRTGRYGDWFGLRRRGLSFARLLRGHPHGLRLSPHHPTGVLRDRIRHRDRRVALFPDAIASEIERAAGRVRATSEAFPLLLISLRELRSHNSWTHNSPKLMRNRSFALRVNPRDADAVRLADGDIARISSKTASIEAPVRVTDEIMAGTVALPWGWGHHGGWRVANAAGGANLNRLTSSDPADLERLAGMSWLNGVPVRLEPIGHEPGTSAQPA